MKFDGQGPKLSSLLKHKLVTPPKYLTDKVETMINQIAKTNGKGLTHLQRKESNRAKEVLDDAEGICN